MENKQKHTKISKILATPSTGQFLEQLSLLEYSTHSSLSGESLSLVPAVSDTRISELYLRTKHEPKVERFIATNNGEGLPAGLIQRAIDLLDETQYESSMAEQSAVKIPDELFEQLVRTHYGSFKK